MSAAWCDGTADEPDATYSTGGVCGTCGDSEIEIDAQGRLVAHRDIRRQRAALECAADTADACAAAWDHVRAKLAAVASEGDYAEHAAARARLEADRQREAGSQLRRLAARYPEAAA